MQDALVRVCIALEEVQRHNGALRENHFEVVHRQSVGTGRLYLAVVREVVLSQEDVVLVQDNISPFHVDRFRQVVNLFVMDLPVDFLIGVNLFLAVRDNVGDNDFVVNDKAHIPGEHLVAIGYRRGTKDVHIVFFKDFLEGGHLADDVFLYRVHAMEHRLIGFAVEGFFQRGRFSR